MSSAIAICCGINGASENIANINCERIPGGCPHNAIRRLGCTHRNGLREVWVILQIGRPRLVKWARPRNPSKIGKYISVVT